MCKNDALWRPNLETLKQKILKVSELCEWTRPHVVPYIAVFASADCLSREWAYFTMAS